jgi:hypothetical protein
MHMEIKQSFKKLLEYGRLVGSDAAPPRDTGDAITTEQTRTAEINHLRMNQKTQSKPCGRFVELLNLCCSPARQKESPLLEVEKQPAQRLMVDLEPAQALDPATQIKRRRARITATRLASLNSYLESDSEQQ